MDRKYIPLRSAAPAVNHGPEALDLEPLKAKKRRVGVSVACNACRRNTYLRFLKPFASNRDYLQSYSYNSSSQCDGLRPTCSNCQEQTARCTYGDDGPEMPDGAKKVVLEIIGILSSLSAEDTRRLLSSLRSKTNASVILSVLRDQTGSTTNSASGSLFEFEAQNAIAYPVVPPLDEMNQGAELYRNLAPFS